VSYFDRTATVFLAVGAFVDSRYFGLVDREQSVGRASRVLVSLDKNHHYVPRLSRSLSLLDE
jgi:hypothetical protein